MANLPANNDYPILDGIAPSFCDIIVKIAAPGAPTLDVKDIKSINTNCSVSVGSAVAGGRVKRRTSGSSKYEASMTVYRHAWHEFLLGMKDLMPKRGNQRIISLVHFGIQVFHTPPGAVDIFEFRIKGCRVMGRVINGSEGDDADVVEVALNPIEIVDVIGGEEYVIL